jgi:hypothetical protein
MSDDTRVPVGRFGRWVAWQEIPAAGFRWSEENEYEASDPSERGPGLGPWLVPVNRSSAARFESVDALQDKRAAGLHRKFARLADGTLEERRRRVLGFARRYGHLDQDGIVWLTRQRAGSGPEFVEGESWARWQSATYRAAALIALWDRFRRGEADELAPVVRLSPRAPGKASVDCFYREGRLYPANPPAADVGEVWFGGAGVVGQDVAVPDGDQGDSILLAVREAIYQHVEKHLGGRLSVIIDRGGTPDLWFAPRTLLAAVYLHFSQEISGRRRGVIRCANPKCNRYFEPEHGLQQYCSGSCRKLAYYHRSREPGQSEEAGDEAAPTV